MKKNNFLKVLTLTVLFCITLPTNSQNATKSLPDLLIEKMNSDVQLTDSQRLVIRKRLVKHIARMEKAAKNSNSSQRIADLQTAQDEYHNFVDSVLTPVQKELKKQKAANRDNK